MDLTLVNCITVMLECHCCCHGDGMSIITGTSYYFHALGCCLVSLTAVAIMDLMECDYNVE